ncbi:tetraspanin-9-like [Mytilus californianus]|uniref:tetraspanin-9-like n=1 Tax=Mytilus californianus TaxID=6549 RepID=UPI00224586D5|nr:tetraspanin-9-like [Mytilus californianus]XP_052060645.1 tetraspanin-9-like [Mytilus californianus]
MGACKSCSRVILVLINILFSLIGIALLIVGSVVRWGTDLMNQYLSDLYKDFRVAINVHDDLDFNIPDLLGDVTLSFIVIGAFFFIIGILGCIGACCTVRPMLILYVVILSILVLAEIAFVVVLFAAQSKVDEWLKKPFKMTLEEYKGIDGIDAVTLGLNFIMTQYDCCGVEGYGDFNDSTLWDREFNKSDGSTHNKSIPAVCCINVTNQDCWQHPNTNNSYMDTGCYDAIKDWLHDNMEPLIGTSAGVLVIEIILVIFACVACSKERSNKEDYENDSYGKPVMDDRSYDAIRAYENQGYRGPHHNRQPYNGYDDRGSYDNRGQRDNRAYQNDVPSRRRDKHY